MKHTVSQALAVPQHKCLCGSTAGIWLQAFRMALFHSGQLVLLWCSCHLTYSHHVKTQSWPEQKDQELHYYKVVGMTNINIWLRKKSTSCQFERNNPFERMWWWPLVSRNIEWLVQFNFDIFQIQQLIGSGIGKLYFPEPRAGAQLSLLLLCCG